MTQEYPDRSVVSMSVDMGVQDSEGLAQSLANVRLGWNLPKYVRTECLLADGRHLSLASTIQRTKTEAGHTLIVTRSTFPKDAPYPHWSPGDRDQQTALEILVQGSSAGTCFLTAWAETWCADALFYILLEASKDRVLLDAVRAIVPSLGELSWTALWSSTFHEVTFYPNAHYQTVAAWVMQRLSNLAKYETYADDGSGQMLTGFDTTVVIAGCVISVLGRLVCKRDSRGIRAAIRWDNVITFRFEALVADRCRVTAQVRAKQFFGCYHDVLAELAHDFPETREALVAGKVPLETTEATPHPSLPPANKDAIGAVGAVNATTTRRKRGKKPYPEYDAALKALMDGQDQDDVFKRYLEVTNSTSPIGKVAKRVRDNFWRVMAYRGFKGRKKDQTRSV